MTKDRKKLYQRYREDGMTEEQINAIKEFDDKTEKGDKEFYKHTVPMLGILRKASTTNR